MVTDSGYSQDMGSYHEPRGLGWTAFAGIMIMLAGSISFIQGHDEQLEAKLVREINGLAAEEKFEDAEMVRRQLEKIQRARKESRDTFPSVWSFDYLVFLPSDSTSRTKVAFVRSGSIVKIEDFETATVAETLPGEVTQIFSSTPSTPNREWQYDEFCLVANYLVHPLKSVELVRVGETDLADYLRKRNYGVRHLDPLIRNTELGDRGV